MEECEIIVSGREFTGTEYLGSFAEVVIPKLKSQPKDFVIQVDCETDETITSQEFLKQSLEFAEGLVEFGVKLGDVVVFACSNSIRSHVGAIGTIFSGAIFAPIDQTLKAFELQYLFKEFKPKVIVCEEEKAKDIQTSAKAINLDCRIVLINSTGSNGEFFVWDDIKTKVDVSNYVPRAVPDSKKTIAVINCSSGSTGMPKGVAISHYSILFGLAMTESMQIDEANRSFLLTSPLFWISGTILLINSCYFGQTRYVPKSTDTEDVLKGIEKSKAHFLMMCPSTLLEMVEHKNFSKYDVSSVKVIFSAGASLGTTIASKVKDMWKGIRICNAYGLTETTLGVAIGFGCEDPNAIGRLVPEIKVKVVDLETEKSLGPNKPGELRVKSKRLMNGYYNNEEATKDAFDANGWFRTGDLVYYDEDGVFYFVNRIKEIIQYLNYKISPVEIEYFILSLAGVKDVAVVPVPHETDGNHLRALVVKSSNSEITAEEIIRQVEENFTERKHLKAGVQFVDVLPRTRVGKLRRAEAQKMVRITN